MVKVLKKATAGRAERNDVLITIQPAEPGSGTVVEITSPVRLEFGRQIEATVKAVLQEQGVSDACVSVLDKSAMDFVIRARTETALRRAMSEV